MWVVSQTTIVVTTTRVIDAAIQRSHGGESKGGDSAHATTASPLTPALTSVPASERLSRRSSHEVISATPCCRSAISLGVAGVFRDRKSVVEGKSVSRVAPTWYTEPLT